MYCIIKCIVQGKQARVKNADLPHPSCTVVMQKRKSASPVLNMLMDWISLAQNMDTWLAHLNMVFTIRVPPQAVKFFTATLYQFHKDPVAMAVVIIG